MYNSEKSNYNNEIEKIVKLKKKNERKNHNECWIYKNLGPPFENFQSKTENHTNF